MIQECVPESNRTNVKAGTICRARCAKIDYELIGPAVRECLILGRWSGYDQICDGTKMIKSMKNYKA